MKLQFISKIITVIIIACVLLFAGCSTNSTQVLEQERGINIEDDPSSDDIARRENEIGDETQEQIENALTTLRASGSYMSPGGRNTIEVEIQVDNEGIIQSARVLEENVPSSTSRTWINRYNQGIEAQVVGVPLSEAISPAVVNRSSLTAEGFNEALNKIRQENQ